ncbi:MAG: hypothetical protein AAB476_02900 [Patescibacteria group bacterium]
MTVFTVCPLRGEAEATCNVSLANSEKPVKFDCTPAIAHHHGFKPEQVRLERAVESNAIGNLYDPNRGQFNMWEWFQDVFEDSYRLSGGARECGGLARVDCGWSGHPDDSLAGRPLVSFVK